MRGELDGKGLLDLAFDQEPYGLADQSIIARGLLRLGKRRGLVLVLQHRRLGGNCALATVDMLQFQITCGALAIEPPSTDILSHERSHVQLAQPPAQHP